MAGTKGWIPKAHGPAAFIRATEVVVHCPWCLLPGTDPFAQEGEDPSLKWSKDEYSRDSGYARTVVCGHCGRDYSTPTRRQIQMMLHVGCLPLFPSYFVSTNRSAVGQYASLDLRRSMDDVIGDYGKETLRRLMRKRATLLVREETVEETQAATKKKARKKL